ncbi:hypothetical protein TARUN_5117 [Trichoderma arundinaceum]|uniref:Uncharacterized protein n=1 Tax=Trichoderma arundinaceum TaxID=490622 RepID=A0A395NM16_TRIAR|nr:hypothetical protein TARUN_5117 [Trichoderma arundinaceum]
MGSLNATRSISAPSPLSNSWQQSTYMDPTTQGSSDYQESPPRSQDTGASLAGGSQATDDTEEFSPLQNTQDFRKLMPRTRSLPFVKDKKAKAAQVAKIAISMSAQRQADKKTSQSRKTPRDSLRARHWKKDSPAEDSDTLAEERDPTKSPEMDSSSPNFQIDSCSSSQPTISLADSPLTVDSSFKAAELPTILAIDDALLEEVNQSTSKLLKQYNADIGRGCDGAACAQFYLEQIHIARREFWFNYLKQGD